MKFKYDPKIDEMLSGFMDGQLTPAEEAEVQRLVGKDKKVARRLNELERCRVLVNSLPPAEPPAKVVAGIQQLIRSRTSGREMEIESRRGARHLFVRHLLAASIMVGLLGILAAVIYKIASMPQGSPPVVALEPREPSRAQVGIYSLQLQTADFTGVDAFIKKLLDDSSWLKVEAKKEVPGRSTYRVLCSRGALEALMSDLAPVWSKFDAATLFVHTDTIGRYVSIEAIRPQQFADIARQDTADQRIRLAKDFATLNSIERLMPGGKLLAFEDSSFPELSAIPKPVLTSGGKNLAVAPKGASDQVRIDLSIVVSSHK